MTAIHAPQALSLATPFERMLLHTAARLDGLVAVRLERRAASGGSRTAQDTASDVRATAQALGSVGILPR